MLEADPFMALSGVAAARGTHWADFVATRRLLDVPWQHTEKGHAIALRWVSDLTDDLELRERLAKICKEYAADWWEQLRRKADRQSY